MICDLVAPQSHFIEGVLLLADDIEKILASTWPLRFNVSGAYVELSKMNASGEILDTETRTSTQASLSAGLHSHRSAFLMFARLRAEHNLCRVWSVQFDYSAFE